ncbi:hypothetical protein B7463_g7936, partial [Scytalidium lignicola]
MLSCLLLPRPGAATLWGFANSYNRSFQTSRFRTLTSRGRKTWTSKVGPRSYSNSGLLDKEEEMTHFQPSLARNTIHQSKPVRRHGSFTIRKVMHGIKSNHRHISPSRALAKWLDTEDRSERLVYWNTIREVVDGSTLPVILLHHLHQSENKDLQANRVDDYLIQQKREALERRGFASYDVDQWGRILQGESPDIMVERFLSLGSQKPPFLLLEILRGDLLKVRSLRSVLTFALNHILAYEPSKVSPDLVDHSKVHIEPSNKYRLKVNKVHGMEDLSFALLLRRLLYQSRRIWPSAMISVAQMVEPYLRLSFQVGVGQIEVDARTHRRVCNLYNELIRTLALPASIDPLKSMTYNWKSQRILLDMAAIFSPPLTLDKSSYRAVVRVLAALKKSEKESMIAALRARSWPPWRVYQDGMDALRSPEDDSSRVVSAVIAAKQSGYPEDAEEIAMMILGGQEPDGTPTIHTRKLLDPKTLDAGVSKHKLKTLPWTARIYATRDVQEAWGAFQDFRLKGGQPDLQMFHAMFEKISFEAKRSHLELEEDRIGVPGDAKEVFPVPDENYSEYWRTRLQPPTVEGLYKDMRSSGIRPAGRCLDFLIEHSASMADAVTYLRDSPLRRVVVQYLTDPNHKIPPQDLFRQLPVSTFGSFVKLLCRFAPKRILIEPASPPPTEEVKPTSGSSHTVQSTDYHEADHNQWTLMETFLPVDVEHNNFRRNPLAHAIELLRQQKPRYRPAWNALFATLARADVVVHPKLLYDPRNDIMACRVICALLNDFYECGLELDVVGFLKLCRAAEKSILASRGLNETERQPVLELIDRIKDEFKMLSETNIVSNNLPRLLHDISGVHLHAYIRILGLTGDHTEIISILNWMVEYNDELLAVSNLSRNGAGLMRRAIVSATVFCNDSPYHDEARHLIESVEHWGGWPEDLEVRQYIDNLPLDYR